MTRIFSPFIKTGGEGVGGLLNVSVPVNIYHFRFMWTFHCCKEEISLCTFLLLSERSHKDTTGLQHLMSLQISMVSNLKVENYFI